VKRIALINWGGIGDEILFSPVVRALKQAYPEATLTLALEHRSRSIQDVLPELDAVYPVELGRHRRAALFARLLSWLRRGQFDMVVSAGSHPAIAPLLWLSGVRVRVGFDVGPLSRWCLTHAAPLERDVYAGLMYFRLAQAVLPDASDAQAQPTLSAPTQSAAADWLRNQPKGSPRWAIHPGVSQMSLEKNILKAWPVSHWIALIERYLAAYPEGQLLILGGPDDAQVMAALSAWRTQLPQPLQARVLWGYGQTRSFADLAAVLTRCDGLVSVDSAPMHLAVGLGLPVVSIFAPTDPKKLLPASYLPSVATVEGLSCQPCLWDKRTVSCEDPQCLFTPVETVFNRLEAAVCFSVS
jgi:putative inorganic carbon (hco3(-)) transporter